MTTNYLHLLIRSIERMWWHRAKPPAWLLPLSWLYAIISRHHLRQRAKHVVTPNLPLISVGNITVGGSSKTPFVIWLAQSLKQRGITPIILCRGQGGTLKHPQWVHQHSTAEQVGDEALLLWQQSQCAVIAGRDRIHAMVMAQDQADVLILDDGFQYRQLGRCCDLVLIPAHEGIGNGAMLPAGPLREPVSALNRADFIIRTGNVSTQSIAYTQGKEWYWHTTAGALLDIQAQQTQTPSHVYAITAIAKPERFRQSLEQKGLHVEQECYFPDHYRFTHEDVAHLCGLPYPIAITRKDAVKLQPLWPKHTPLWVLEQHADAEQGLLDAMLDACPASVRNKRID